MLQFEVDRTLCHSCGECERDCLANIIKLDDDGYPVIDKLQEPRCMKCQHCLAVCTEGAISILGKSPANSIALTPEAIPSFEQIDALVRGRRSVRHYEQRNVDQHLLSRILAALSHVPTGVNACELTFTVIDDIAVMDNLKSQFIGLVRKSESENIPDRYRWLVELPDDALASVIFRGAPHAIIVSAPPDAPCPTEDASLTIATFDLLAQSSGLGCVWWGFLKMFAIMIPEIKDLIGIPRDHIFAAALFGMPNIKFQRTVQKDDVMKIKRLELRN